MQKANAIGDIASSVGGLVDTAAGGGMLGDKMQKFSNKFQPSSSGGGGGGNTYNYYGADTE